MGRPRERADRSLELRGASPQPAPRGPQLRVDGSPAVDLPLGEPAGDEGCGRRVVAHRQGAEAVLGDDRVVMLAEEVLQGLRCFEEAASRLPRGEESSAA